MNEIVTIDGEIIEASTSMAVQLQKGEIDQMISTAKAYPRSLQRVKQAILSMATLDEESAEECMYALPRGGKPIKGPSIRFAEILKQAYGNCRAAARVVHIDKAEGFVEAEGMFHDLETNSASTARVRRRILDKHGKVFKDDMIIVTGNAACSIAMRNAILNGVPKPLWRKAYDTVQATIAGDITTLAVNREKAIKAMATFGVKPERVFEALGIAGEEEIGTDHIVTLRGMFAALKNGEATVEEMFVGTAPSKSDHQKVADPLADDPQPPKPDARQQPATAEPDTNEAAGTAPDRQEAPGDTSPASELSQEDGAEVDPDAPAGQHEDAITPAPERLVSYARDMMAIAGGDGDAGLKKDRLGKAHTRWRDDIAKLAPEEQERAKSILVSAQMVAKGEADHADAVAFFADVMGVEPGRLTENGNG